MNWNPLTWFRRSNSPTFAAHPSSPLMGSIFNLGQTVAGVHVNAHTAMQSSAWWSGIRLLSDSVALLPCRLMQDTERESKPAKGHPASRIMTSPSPVMTRFDFYRTAMTHVLSRGNFYAEILLEQGSRRPARLAIMNPDDMQVSWSPSGDEKVYKAISSGAEWRQSQVFHVPGLGFDGLVGYNVVEFARQSLALDLAVEQYGASWFGSGGRPNATLKYTGPQMKPEVAERVRADWKRIHSAGSHEVALLQDGMDVILHDNDPSKSQATETRKFQILVVARFLRIPPHLLYALESGAPDIAQMGDEFVTYSLSPWLTAFEEEADRKILTEADQASFHHEFDECRFLRGDAIKRGAKNVADVNAGLRTVAEIRKDEGDPYIEGTDQLRVPLNYGRLNADGTVTNNGEGNSNGNGMANQFDQLTRTEFRCGGEGGTPGPCPEGDKSAKPTLTDAQLEGYLGRKEEESLSSIDDATAERDENADAVQGELDNIAKTADSETDEEKEAELHDAVDSFIQSEIDEMNQKTDNLAEEISNHMLEGHSPGEDDPTFAKFERDFEKHQKDFGAKLEEAKAGYEQEMQSIGDTAKNYVSARLSGDDARAEREQQDLDAAGDAVRDAVKTWRSAAMLATVTFAARLRASAERASRSFERRCGGVGGTPGPCPQKGDGKAAESAHRDADEKSKTLVERMKELPAKVATAAKDKVAQKYKQLEGRYGRGMAIAILAAGIAGLPLPLPGSSLITAAPLLAAGELYRAFSSHRAHDPANFTEGELRKLGVEWLQSILDEWEKENVD